MRSIQQQIDTIIEFLGGATPTQVSSIMEKLNSIEAELQKISACVNEETNTLNVEAE